MNEEYVGVILTATGLALVVAGIAMTIVVVESALALVCLAATVGLGVLTFGCVLLYRAFGRRGRK